MTKQIATDSGPDGFVESQYRTMNGEVMRVTRYSKKANIFFVRLPESKPVCLTRTELDALVAMIRMAQV